MTEQVLGWVSLILVKSGITEVFEVELCRGVSVLICNLKLPLKMFFKNKCTPLKSLILAAMFLSGTRKNFAHKYR